MDESEEEEEHIWETNPNPRLLERFPDEILYRIFGNSFITLKLLDKLLNHRVWYQKNIFHYGK